MVLAYGIVHITFLCKSIEYTNIYVFRFLYKK